MTEHETGASGLPVLAYIGLGSNLDSPRNQIRKAIASLDKVSAIRVTRNAGFYTSTPMGPQDQPDFVNSVVEIETSLDPQSLLRTCQDIEAGQGRIRSRHWGERSIDLDILLYSDACFQSAELTIPHPGITRRDFVYLPLLALNESIELPGAGKLNTIISLEQESTGKYSCRFDGLIE